MKEKSIKSRDVVNFHVLPKTAERSDHRHRARSRRNQYSQCSFPHDKKEMNVQLSTSGRGFVLLYTSNILQSEVGIQMIVKVCRVGYHKFPEKAYVKSYKT